MKEQMRRKIKISAKGKELYKFINALHSSRVSCAGQYCKKDVFYGEIHSSGLDEVLKLAEKYDIELEHHEYNNVFIKIKKYRLRFGIIAGMILTLFGSLYFSNVVVSIDIHGNSTVSDREILAALDEVGIRRGKFIHDIDIKYCENELRVMLDDIAWAGIRRTGNRIVVEVTETVRKPDMVHERTPCNLVASKEADIISTTVYDGFLLHKVGDHVVEGTLLVSGVYADAYGRTVISHAMGKIRGRYKEKVEFSGEFKSVRREPSGEVENENYLRLFSLDIPLFIGKKEHEFTESETSEKKFELFGKDLHIGTMKKKVTVFEQTETTLTEEELRDELMGKVYLYEKNFLSGDTEIIDRKISEKKAEEGITLTVEYVAEGNICEEREIFIK